jgi:outer membrane protein
MKCKSPCWPAVLLCFLLMGVGPERLRAQQDQTSQAPQTTQPAASSRSNESTKESAASVPVVENAGSAKKPQTSTLEFTPRGSFPNILGPYLNPAVPQLSLDNSHRLHSLIQNGKLQLSVDDAIALALENNLDIAIARYNLPLSQADYLRSKAGSAVRGTGTSAFISNALFANAIGSSTTSNGGTSNGGGAGGAGFSSSGAKSAGSIQCCDPFAGFFVGWDQNTTALGTTALTGVPFLNQQSTGYQAFYGQGFLTGTSVVVAMGGSRSTTSALTTLLNPQVSTFGIVTITQPLLNGFGYRSNAVSIRIARNDLKFADSQFRQQVMTTTANVLNLYSSLLSARENVRVAQEALRYAQKLLEDNKRQVEIGTLAPIEVVRAESEVAADEQSLVVAQTTYQQQQENMKTALSKHVDADLAGVEVEATDKLPDPKPDDIPPLKEALAEALNAPARGEGDRGKGRPEIEQAELNIRNQEYTVQAVRRRLLPTFDLFASYAPTGLSGHALCGGNAFQPVCPPGVIGYLPGGVSQSLTALLHGNYPDYSLGANLQIPLRNRQAQADTATALLQERQLRTTLQKQKNLVEQDVRNAEIAVTQAKAQIAAAGKATELARETMDAEQKKFQLGESTVFQVIQTQRDLATAEGNEVKARTAYAQALTQFQQATGTILDRHHIEIADAKNGQVSRQPNIPGTPEPTAAGNQP